MCHLSDVTGATGPVTTSYTLIPPVLLGSPGAAETFDDNAAATADVKTLGARAHGTVTVPGGGSPVALASSSGAALFEERLTATSPLVTIPRPGFVRSTFDFHGSLSTPGPVVPFLPASGEVGLLMTHDGGGIFAIVFVDSSRGDDALFLKLRGRIPS